MFVDSINLKFAEYLAKSWEQFNVEPPLVRPLKPEPKTMPVYVPDDTATMPPPILAEPVQIDTISAKNDKQPEKVEKSSNVLFMNFFGIPVTFNSGKKYEINLTGTNEKQISDGWKQLSKYYHSTFLDELIEKKTNLNLGSWGFYRLILEWANANFSQQQKNEKTLFVVYVLNRAGYKAKIGQVNGTLVVLVAFRNKIYGKPYIRVGKDCYYILSDGIKMGTPVSSYRLDYDSATSYFDLRMQTLPKFAGNIRTVKRTFRNKVYAFQCNGDLADFFKTFPQAELEIYADTPFSGIAEKSITKELARDLRDKTVTEKLKFLLALIQYGFEYKTDEEQFGYESFFFPEETLFYPYSDCEDRAMLFCRMVKLLCDLDTLLIEYPTHVASAVKSNEPGDAVIFNNERYIVCDPTCIGAPIAKTMKGYDNASAKIIPVR